MSRPATVRRSAFLLAAVVTAGPAIAQEAPSIYLRAVDLAEVQADALPGPEADGPVELLGLAVRRDETGLTFAVRRDWLDRNLPAVAAATERGGQEEPDSVAKPTPTEEPTTGLLTGEAAVRATETLRSRTISWLDRTPPDGPLTALLEGEADRVSAWLAAVDAARARGEVLPEYPVPNAAPPAYEPAAEPPADRGDWVTLHVPAGGVTRLVRQTPRTRRIALHAAAAGLPRLERRTADDLADALYDAGVDPAAPIDLPGAAAVTAADEVDPKPADAAPVYGPREQSDREWAAREAVVESIHSDEFSFQGTGSKLIRTPAAGQPVNVQALLGEMAGGQYQDLIAELTDPNYNRRRRTQPRESNAQATTAAERAGRRGVRVTRVKPDLTTGRVTLASTFLARMPDGTWAPVWTATRTGSAADVDPDTERRIREDPQVKGVLRMAEGLGLGGGGLGGLGGLGLGAGGGDPIGRAVTLGAVTKSLLDDVNADYEQFRAPHASRLDGPVIVVP